MFEQGHSNLFLLSIFENKVVYPGFSYHKKFPNFDSLASLTDSSNLHVVSSTLFRVFRIVWFVIRLRACNVMHAVSLKLVLTADETIS